MALRKTRHGPLPRPADDLRPQILCILWLDASNGPWESTLEHMLRCSEHNTKQGVRKKEPSPASRDHLHTLPPPRTETVEEALGISYQRAAAARTTFCDLYHSQIPGRSALQATGKAALCEERRPRAGTLTAYVLHGVASGCRPDRRRHQGSLLVGSSPVDALHPGGDQTDRFFG
jgi:hypothetical protein